MRLSSDLHRLDQTPSTIEGVELNPKSVRCEPCEVAAKACTVNHAHGSAECTGRYNYDKCAWHIEEQCIDRNAGELEQRVSGGDGLTSIREIVCKERFRSADCRKRSP